MRGGVIIFITHQPTAGTRKFVVHKFVVSASGVLTLVTLLCKM